MLIIHARIKAQIIIIIVFPSRTIINFYSDQVFKVTFSLADFYGEIQDVQYNLAFDFTLIKKIEYLVIIIMIAFLQILSFHILSAVTVVKL